MPAHTPDGIQLDIIPLKEYNLFIILLCEEKENI